VTAEVWVATLEPYHENSTVLAVAVTLEDVQLAAAAKVIAGSPEYFEKRVGVWVPDGAEDGTEYSLDVGDDWILAKRHTLITAPRPTSPAVCTDPTCTIPRKPGFPMHGPHDMRAR
jgi:hypothetical protein